MSHYGPVLDPSEIHHPSIDPDPDRFMEVQTLDIQIREVTKITILVSCVASTTKHYSSKEAQAGILFLSLCC